MSAQVRAREQGLSLIELLLALAISALVMAPLLPMLQTASGAARIAGDRVALEREADFALERIAARIRVTQSAPRLLEKNSSEWLKPAVYTLGDGRLVEELGGKSHILAESVKDFSLDARSVDSMHPLVIVSLSLERRDAAGAITAATTASATVRMGSAL